MIVRTAPEIETWVVSVTAMVVWVPSVRFLTVMLPVPMAMFSLKVATRFAVTATPVALSTGLKEEITGAVPPGRADLNRLPSPGSDGCDPVGAAVRVIAKSGARIRSGTTDAIRYPQFELMPSGCQIEVARRYAIIPAIAGKHQCSVDIQSGFVIDVFRERDLSVGIVDLTGIDLGRVVSDGVLGLAQIDRHTGFWIRIGRVDVPRHRSIPKPRLIAS